MASAGVPAGARRRGVEHATPYYLRHSFASLLLWEGKSAVYVARQLGHDANLTNGTCGHVIEELEDAPKVSAEDAIRAARRRDVRPVYVYPGGHGR